MPSCKLLLSGSRHAGRLRRIHASVVACSSSERQELRATSVPLPGAVWLFRPSAENLFRVYGDNFVIRKQDPSRASAGLVRVGKHSVPAVRGNDSLAPLPERGSVALLPNHQSGMIWEPVIIPSNDASAEATAAGFQLAIIPQETMLDNVLQAAIGKVEDGPANFVFETTSKSPRRTSKVKFTCDLCGAINIKPVNPFAWTEGTVFAKCANCDVTHKLIDNLKLFHELSGPVFIAPKKLNIEIPPDLPNPLDSQSHPF